MFLRGFSSCRPKYLCPNFLPRSIPARISQPWQEQTVCTGCTSDAQHTERRMLPCVESTSRQTSDTVDICLAVDPSYIFVVWKVVQGEQEDRSCSKRNMSSSCFNIPATYGVLGGYGQCWGMLPHVKHRVTSSSPGYFSIYAARAGDSFSPVSCDNRRCFVDYLLVTTAD